MDAMKSPLVKLPKPVRGALFHLLQWTWCLPQNLFGALAALALRGERFRYHGALVTIYKKTRLLDNESGFSLGSFIFMPEGWSDYDKKHIVVHEYGHTVQSLFTGPLYLLLVGVPSLFWSRRYTKRSPAYRSRGIGYCDRYPERGADRLGELVTGEKPQ
ncbi:MAG: hypothetical protein K6G56_01175 [Clostridiales bacterium]|nr:hypothetical protein [Clostridiales bacterium]